MVRSKIIIMGAAGRDFHDFNTYFRDREDLEVIAFTAAQIPNIEGRTYPPELAGPLYPNGIPIYAEDDLPNILAKNEVEQVILAYSDIAHLDVMHIASEVLSLGADFRLMNNAATTLSSSKPVISVCAVRTGAGKSPTTRKICAFLHERGLKVAVIRHPMPYGDILKQIAQRYSSYDDLDANEVTFEEREEIEPLLDSGVVVFLGVDYKKILEKAEDEADIIIWDGGNNDLPFIKSDLHIVIADPLRPGDEIAYHPGEANVRMADVIVVNKVQTADRESVLEVMDNCKTLNPNAIMITAASPITLDRQSLVTGKKVLVIEDGPTVTHGDMAFGAGLIAAEDAGAAEIVDPRPYAIGSIARTLSRYPHLTNVLPAMGYSPEQVWELERTISNTPCDVVVAGTPIDLHRVLNVDKPIVRARYDIMEIGQPTLKDIVFKWLDSNSIIAYTKAT